MTVLMKFLSVSCKINEFQIVFQLYQRNISLENDWLMRLIYIHLYSELTFFYIKPSWNVNLLKMYTFFIPNQIIYNYISMIDVREDRWLFFYILTKKKRLFLNQFIPTPDSRFLIRSIYFNERAIFIFSPENKPRIKTEHHEKRALFRYIELLFDFCMRKEKKLALLIYYTKENEIENSKWTF